MRAITFGIAFGLTGCTTVTIHNAEVSRQTYPGWVQLTVTPHAQGVSLVRSSGLGLVLGPRSASLGWLDETHWTTRDAHACRVLVLVKDAAEAERLLALGAFRDGGASLCVLQQATHPKGDG